MDVMSWILIGVIASLSIVIGWLIFAFIDPMRRSPAMFFVRAKRKNKPVCILDNGTHWVIVTGKREEEGFIEDDTGNPITITPNSLKYCRGVLLGVGENHRSMIVNTNLASIINSAKNKKIEIKDLKEIINKIEKAIENEQNKEEDQNQFQEEMEIEGWKTY